MRIKVRGGTASDGEPSLCLTCRFATVVKGARLRDEIVECSQLSYGRNRVTFPVTQCTEYSDRRQPSLSGPLCTSPSSTRRDDRRDLPSGESRPASPPATPVAGESTTPQFTCARRAKLPSGAVQSRSWMGPGRLEPKTRAGGAAPPLGNRETTLKPSAATRPLAGESTSRSP